MKFPSLKAISTTADVAPFAGAWIEINKTKETKHDKNVAPFAGAWIEISTSIIESPQVVSHPSRVRGLKLDSHARIQSMGSVAPFAGAWIEI